MKRLLQTMGLATLLTGCASQNFITPVRLLVLEDNQVIKIQEKQAGDKYSLWVCFDRPETPYLNDTLRRFLLNKIRTPEGYKPIKEQLPLFLNNFGDACKIYQYTRIPETIEFIQDDKYDPWYDKRWNLNP